MKKGRETRKIERETEYATSIVRDIRSLFQYESFEFILLFSHLNTVVVRYFLSRERISKKKRSRDEEDFKDDDSEH